MIFEPAPKAKANLKAGAVYAVDGGEGWIYYGQVAADETLGFFGMRTAAVARPDAILTQPIMSRFVVALPSIGRALRSGHWKSLGRYALELSLQAASDSVQWPVGTLTVTVWRNGKPAFDARVEDPAIQDIERMSVWDAEHHVPARLKADFGAEPAAWHVGGPIWRERLVKEEMARRWPDRPEHRLPEDWVRTKS